MTSKLVQDQAEWIAKRSGRMTSPDAGRAMGVGARRVRQIRTAYRRTGDVPVLGRPGRRRKEFPPWVVCKVLWARRTYRVGATALEAILGIPGLSHNMIHRILEEHGMVNKTRRRARRAPWVRYEREYSNSMWHTDWTLLPGGRWLIAYEDDASRLIIGYGIFDRATSANAVGVLRRAIAEYGKPASIMTDHGSQFYATEVGARPRAPTEFERFLVASEIRHVLSGVGHPQTNGKTGRFFGEARARLGTFADAGEIVAWRDTARPHRSPNSGAGETPCEAFEARMPTEDAEVVVGGHTGESYRVHRGRPRPAEAGS